LIVNGGKHLNHYVTVIIKNYAVSIQLSRLYIVQMYIPLKDMDKL